MKILSRGAGLFALISVMSSPLLAAQWEALPSPPEYKAMVELSTVQNMKSAHRFIMRRAYHASHQYRGQTYRSTVIEFRANCDSQRLLAIATSYLGEDNKVVHTERKERYRLDEFFPAKNGSDEAEALNIVCRHIAARP